LATLLIVEDDEQLISVMAAYLEMNDFNVLQTTSVAGCLKMIEQNRIDLIVLDLTLPDEDGLVLLRRLKASSSIPIACRRMIALRDWNLEPTIICVSPLALRNCSTE